MAFMLHSSNHESFSALSVPFHETRIRTNERYNVNRTPASFAGEKLSALCFLSLNIRNPTDEHFCMT